MNNGARLRFVGSPQYPASQLPLQVGKEYEVAEIFELEGSVMVREVGATDWPAPGDPRFGWDPGWFAPTPHAIPIISCGYPHHTLLSDFFGVLTTRPEDTDAVHRLAAVEPPEDEESFEDWQARAAGRVAPTAADALYEILALSAQCHFGAFWHVLRSDPPLPEAFGYMGWYLADLARNAIALDTVEDALMRLADALQVSGVEPGEIHLDFWQGTGGGERLLHAPPDGRLVYGTRNPPLDEPPAGPE